MDEKYDAYYDKEHDYENKEVSVEDLDWPRDKKEIEIMTKRVSEEFKPQDFGFMPWKGKDSCYEKMTEKEREEDDKKDRDYLNIDKDLDEFARPHTKEENTLFLFRYWKEHIKYFEPEEDNWD